MDRHVSNNQFFVPLALTFHALHRPEVSEFVFVNDIDGFPRFDSITGYGHSEWMIEMNEPEYPYF
jgi:hypothetical protein